MKILYITEGQKPDYMNDCVFHGLVSNGHDVTDTHYLYYMSDKHPELYGRGFTVYGNLDDRSGIDREHIKDRIVSKEFDIVVFGSVHRHFEYLDVVLSTYDKSRIIFIDGEDHTNIRMELVGKGVYFKREYLQKVDGVYPISFAIPQEKIFFGVPSKTKTWSFITPKDTRTYIYHDETKYYEDYRSSIYGFTMKKGGWDCMRHYEIAAQQCIPWFENINNCPPLIMTNWPKKLLYDVISKKHSDSQLLKIREDMFDVLVGKMTTSHLADYVLRY